MRRARVIRNQRRLGPLKFLRLFQDLNANDGITIVLVTHESDIARCARRIVNFIDGRIAYDGPAAEFFAQETAAA